jgi:hypothetical protein
MDMELGQLFSKETQAIFFNWKEKPVQVGSALSRQLRVAHARHRGHRIDEITVLSLAAYA